MRCAVAAAAGAAPAVRPIRRDDLIEWRHQVQLSPSQAIGMRVGLLLVVEWLLYPTGLLATSTAGERNPAADAPPPIDVLYWPLKNATSANGAALSYEERALALAFQGIVNAKDGVGDARHQSQQAPTLFFDAVSTGWNGCSSPTSQLIH